MTARTRAAFVAASCLTITITAGCHHASAPSAHTSPTATVSFPPPVSESTARQRLLTTADIGSQFRSATYTASGTPLPCPGSASGSLAMQTNASYNVGAHFVAANADIVEEVLGYPSTSDTKAALVAVQDGFDCSTGTLASGTGATVVVAIGAQRDFSAIVGAASAYGWSELYGSERATQVAIVSGPTMVLLRYSLGDAADIASLPDGNAVAKMAYQRENG